MGQKLLGKLKSRQVIVYISVLLVSVLFITVFHHIATGGQRVFGVEAETPFVKAKVLDVLSVESAPYGEDGTLTTVTFEARALNGEKKGKTLRATQELDSVFALQSPQVQEGDKILLDYVSGANGESGYVFFEFQRTGPMVALTILFFALLLIFGRMKGVSTIISLGFACLAVFCVLVPAAMKGHNIYGWSILTGVFIIFSTLLFINGASQKSLTAAIGCTGGVLAAGLVMLAVRGSMKITGLLEEESIYLATLDAEHPIDLKATVFAMIIIGALGAVMDVAMSVSSSLYEIKEKSPDISASALMQSGFTIGRDMMGTMANTLVLAYIGSSMTCLLVMLTYTANLTQMLNRELIAVDILQAIAGSLGILLTIPLTSLVCSIFYVKRK